MKNSQESLRVASWVLLLTQRDDLRHTGSMFRGSWVPVPKGMEATALKPYRCWKETLLTQDQCLSRQMGLQKPGEGLRSLLHLKVTNYCNLCPCHSLTRGFDAHAYTFISVCKSMLLKSHLGKVLSISFYALSQHVKFLLTPRTLCFSLGLSTNMTNFYLKAGSMFKS